MGSRPVGVVACVEPRASGDSAEVAVGIPVQVAVDVAPVNVDVGVAFKSTGVCVGVTVDVEVGFRGEVVGRMDATGVCVTAGMAVRDGVC